MNELERLGWNASRQRRFEDWTREAGVDARPARVAGEGRDRILLFTEEGAVEALMTGRVARPDDWLGRPAVGDWVLWQPEVNAVVAVLPRTSVFIRKTAGRRSLPQVVGANLDRVLVVTTVGRDLNARRLERYLAATWAGGAEPLVVVNKTDLPHDPEAVRRVLDEAAPGVAAVWLAATSDPDVEGLRAGLRPGETVALVGSSGVGKSTVVNRLLGEARQDTRAVRAGDDKGRHTTTRRALVGTPDGVWLLDTPGLRELGLFDARAGVARAFEDLEAVAQGCRFADCGHETEPGCAVQAAVDSGLVPATRLEGWRRLQRELAFEAWRRDEREAAEGKKRWKEIHKEVRRRRKLHRKLGLKE